MTATALNIIGIDAASKQSDTAIAWATAERSQDRWVLTLHGVTTPDGESTIYEIMQSWVDDELTNLVAVDAPLGWPEAMAEALNAHQAGQLLGKPPTAGEAPTSKSADDRNLRGRSTHLFSRYTDRWIHQKTGKKPLEVGAAMIARAASAILYRLYRLGYEHHTPLAPQDLRGPGWLNLIEVYPAATLKAIDRGLTRPSYKSGSAAGDQRRLIFDRLRQSPGLSVEGLDAEEVVASDDILDAVLCVVGAFDFLNGQSMAPCAEAFEDRQDWQAVARREGWIWCRGLQEAALIDD